MYTKFQLKEGVQGDRHTFELKDRQRAEKILPDFSNLPSLARGMVHKRVCVFERLQQCWDYGVEWV